MADMVISCCQDSIIDSKKKAGQFPSPNRCLFNSNRDQEPINVTVSVSQSGHDIVRNIFTIHNY